MLAVERRNMILEKLQDERKVVVSELSTLFDVSEETIRRDLDKLDRQGLAIKSYGGAVLNENSGLDMPFNVRKKRNIRGKQEIADIVSSCRWKPSAEKMGVVAIDKEAIVFRMANL